MEDYGYLLMWLAVGLNIQFIFCSFNVVEWQANLMTFILTPILATIANDYLDKKHRTKLLNCAEEEK